MSRIFWLFEPIFSILQENRSLTARNMFSGEQRLCGIGKGTSFFVVNLYVSQIDISSPMSLLSTRLYVPTSWHICLDFNRQLILNWGKTKLDFIHPFPSHPFNSLLFSYSHTNSSWQLHSSADKMQLQIHSLFSSQCLEQCLAQWTLEVLWNECQGVTAPGGTDFIH